MEKPAMPSLCVLLISLALQPATGTGESAAPEPLLPEAAAALAEFRTAADEAAQDLAEALDAAIETAKKRRSGTPEERLEIVNDLERQQELFDSSRVLPNSSLLRGADTRYRRACEQATTRLDRTLKPILAGLVDAEMHEAATRLMELRDTAVIGPGHELIGAWQLREGRGSHGYIEQFVIDKQFGRWSMHRTFTDERGRVVGESNGTDFSFSGGTLQYIDIWELKPVATWDENCTFEISLAENFDGLQVRWVAPRGAVGGVSLIRVE
jgi:hypothetical protein